MDYHRMPSAFDHGYVDRGATSVYGATLLWATDWIVYSRTADSMRLAYCSNDSDRSGASQSAIVSWIAEGICAWRVEGPASFAGSDLLRVPIDLSGNSWASDHSIVQSYVWVSI